MLIGPAYPGYRSEDLPGENCQPGDLGISYRFLLPVISPNNHAVILECHRRVPTVVETSSVQSFSDPSSSSRQPRAPPENSFTMSKEYTYQDVAEHNTKKDIFVVIHDVIYDATKFVDEHP